MKKTLSIVLLALLIAGAFAAVPAQAKKKKKPKKSVRVERLVEYEYQTASPGISGVVGACMTVLGVEGTACQDFPTLANESFVKVVVEDATGQPTNFDIAQDVDGPDVPGLNIIASGCGESAEAIPITPGLAVRVSVTALGGPDCPGVATTGAVKATLSNMP